MKVPAEGRSEAWRKMLEELGPLFWDTDPALLDMDANAPYIIARLLNMGGMAGYCWVNDLYPDQVIADAVIHRRDIRPVVRSFMAQKYNIPAEQLVTAPAWR